MGVSLPEWVNRLLRNEEGKKGKGGGGHAIVLKLFWWKLSAIFGAVAETKWGS